MVGKIIQLSLLLVILNPTVDGRTRMDNKKILLYLLAFVLSVAILFFSTLVYSFGNIFILVIGLTIFQTVMRVVLLKEPNFFKFFQIGIINMTLNLTLVVTLLKAVSFLDGFGVITSVVAADLVTFVLTRKHKEIDIITLVLRAFTIPMYSLFTLIMFGLFSNESINLIWLLLFVLTLMLYILKDFLHMYINKWATD